MRWKHDKEWISLTNDTSEGFILEAECQVHEAPHVITILAGNSDLNRYFYFKYNASFQSNNIRLRHEKTTHIIVLNF